MCMTESEIECPAVSLIDIEPLIMTPDVGEKLIAKRNNMRVDT